MPSKKKILIFAALLGLVGLIAKYACSPVYSVNPFFVLSLNDPATPINELFRMHYALSSYVVLTPVALNAKGHLYIVGKKDDKVKVIMLNSQGKIERIITPRLKDGRFLKNCYHISVSPCGEHIWTFEEGEANAFFDRIMVHDLNGKAKADWLVGSHATNHWRIYAYDKNSAYVVIGNGGLNCLHFIVGRRHTKEFRMPIILSPVFFHKGKFWQIVDFNDFQKFFQLKFKKQNKQNENESLKFHLRVISWSPEEGIRLVRKFAIKFPVKLTIGWIRWIDEQGNLYVSRPLSLKSYLLEFVSKIKLLEKLIQALGIFQTLDRVVEVLFIISPRGEILDSIVLDNIVQPAKGERIEIGQLIKADETGIYLEVEKIDEPREYRIVRIVKKPRWKVWWERLKKR